VLQLYVLSVLFNGMIGCIMLAGDNDKSVAVEDGPGPLGLPFSKLTFFIGLSVLSVGTGILKLFANMNAVVIVGDLLPALSGILAGFSLLFAVYRQKASHPSGGGGKLDDLGAFLLEHRKIAGVVFLLVALLHFLFPGALFF